MGGLTLNAMVFKHSKFPNAAKAFLAFMLENEQYEPWLNANCGYWSQPLAAYADAEVWSGDPKVQLFKDAMNSRVLHRLQGTDLAGERRGQRRLRAGADVRVGRDRRGDAGGGGRRSRAPREALLSRAAGWNVEHVPVIARRSDRRIARAWPGMKTSDGRDKPRP